MPVGFFEVRRPGVVIIDSVGAIIALFFLLEAHKQGSVVYQTIVIIAYLASISHHWWEEHRIRHACDLAMVMVLTGGTVFPYVYVIALSPWQSVGTVVLGVLVGVVVLGVIGFFLHNTMAIWLRLGAYLFAGLLSVAIMVLVSVQIGSLEFTVVFWAGVVLYALQMVVYKQKAPDPVPFLYGYRELQHTLILVATILHGYLAVNAAHYYSITFP